VKLGWEVSRLCLRAGANDCGGTLMEENISSASGEVAATSATPEELQAFILSEGRMPVERSTTYRVLRRHRRDEVLARISILKTQRQPSDSLQRQ